MIIFLVIMLLIVGFIAFLEMLAIYGLNQEVDKLRKEQSSITADTSGKWVITPDEKPMSIEDFKRLCDEAIIECNKVIRIFDEMKK